MQTIILTGLFTIIISTGIAQKAAFQPLKIGDKVPSVVWNKIPKNATTKLVLLDFWSTWCTSCFAAFPKMEALQQQFEKEIQIVLVNPNESEAKVKERLDKINGRTGNGGEGKMVLSKMLPRITGDKTFHKLFPATGVPHHVWIDKKGVVKYVTYDYNATPQKIQSVLRGEIVKMQVKDDLLGIELSEKGLLKPFNKVAGQTYYSAFSDHLDVGISGGITTDTANNSFRNLFFNENVIRLFQAAFWNPKNGNRYRERVWIEIDDKELYTIPDYDKDADRIDEWNSKYSFTYELQLPLAERNSYHEKMQQDVNYYFGKKFGIEGFKEKGKLRSLILVKTENGKLTASNAATRNEFGHDKILLVNSEFENFTGVLSDYLEGYGKIRPVIDETGISPNHKIDIEISGSLKDLDNVRGQLKKYGLDLVEGIREVEVLVIRDKIGKG